MNAPVSTETEDPGVTLGELTESVGFMLRMAQLRIYAQFFREFEGTGVKPGEFTVLWVISLNPGLRQGTLARQLNIKAAHMTKLVARLVNSGLVARSVPPEDRRSVRLSLTDTGESFVQRHRDTFVTVHRAERIGLTDDEARQLLGLLDKLAFKDDL